MKGFNNQKEKKRKRWDVKIITTTKRSDKGLSIKLPGTGENLRLSSICDI